MLGTLALGALACLASFQIAVAQPRTDTYPSRPVKMVVPFPPGGVATNVARILADRLSATWGHNVIVDNRPGANGITGTNVVAKASADGYTIGLVLANHVLNPFLYAEMPFDAERDFSPISLVAEYPLLLVVNPNPLCPAGTVPLASPFPRLVPGPACRPWPQSRQTGTPAGRGCERK